MQVFKVYLPHRGGIVSTIQNLTEGLKDRVRSSILVSWSRGVGGKELLNGVPVTRTSSLLELWGMPLAPTYPMRFWRAARQADIVHYHFPFPLVDLAVAIKFPRRVGLVVHWHSDIVAQQRSGRLAAPLVKRCLARADRVIVATPYHVELSPFLRPIADKCVIIPFGVDIARWRRLDADDQAELERARAAFGDFFLTVGRLVPYKGLDVLLATLAEAPGQSVIVGDGPLRRPLEQLALKLGVAQRVHFTGDIGFRRLKALLHACRFFVFPSVALNETFGIAQLEAMACGKAIINTRAHPGVGWVARHEQEALTVPAGDSAALGAAIRRLWENPQQCERLGAAGLRRTRRMFTLERFLEETLAVYQAVQADRNKEHDRP